MQPLERNGYSDQQIKDVLHGKYAARQIDFRYELLDRLDNKKKDLQTVISGEVSMSALAQIKRTARFQIKEDPEIDWLSDRIKPYCILKVETINTPITTTWSDIGAKKWGDV